MATPPDNQLKSIERQIWARDKRAPAPVEQWDPEFRGDIDMRIAREEVFGPVLSVIPFTDEEEAIAIANDTRFGLAAGVWTRDLERALRCVDRIRAGTVWVNNYRSTSFTTPFGGYKESGFGRDLGEAALEQYTETKSVWVDLS